MGLTDKPELKLKVIIRAMENLCGVFFPNPQMIVSSFAMVWDVWIVDVRGEELVRRNKLLISHTDGVYMAEKLKANILKKFQTHTK